MGYREDELMELVGLYMDIAEKQDEVIFRLGNIVRRQAEKIAHLNNVYGFFECGNEVSEEEKNLAKEAFEEYKSMCSV